MQKEFNQRQKYYFSEKLKKQLKKIPQCPVTIIEAPAGFGKTTAIREYLNENLSKEARQYWYSCLGESTSMSWRNIVNLFSEISTKVSNNLKKLNMPNIDTLYYMIAYIREINCETETYLVLDNYHLVNCDIPRLIINAFSMHDNSNLHIIFITQKLEYKQNVFIYNDNINNIKATYLLFSREDIANLFRLEGIRLSNEELEDVYINTEGWIAAVQLQMINYMETDKFEYTSDIELLVENAIIGRLSEDEKNFLICISVLDDFTVKQAAMMLEQEVLPRKIEKFLKNSSFILYSPEKNVYCIRRILLNYLRNCFEHCYSKNYKSKVFEKAGISCAKVSQYYPSAEFFYKVKDFDAILSLPFNREYLDREKEKYQSEFIVKIVNECPKEILFKYPFTMIVFGYQTLMNGEFSTYRKLCKLLDIVIEKQKDFSGKKLRELSSEYMFLVSIGYFNDLNKMLSGLKATLKILDKHSETLKSDIPWLFGTVSVLNMFWSKSGDLENELILIDNCAALYRKLYSEHGVGYNIAIRAEAMLMQGDDEKAEILCHKALYEARSCKQVSSCICAELILTRIAILRGDAKRYFTGIKNIQDYAKESSNIYIYHMVEQAMSIISLILENKDYVATWLYDLKSIKNILYFPAVQHAQILYLKILLMENRYSELCGICQIINDEANDESRNFKYIMTQLQCFKYLAIAKLNMGNVCEAQEYIKQALTLALPDKIYLPFAEEIDKLGYLLECMKESIDSKEINDLIKLGKRLKKGAEVIKKAIISQKSPLTPREREVALYAKDRLSAKEIASKLCISETTVRTIIRNIYSKLDIHSKIELISKEI